MRMSTAPPGQHTKSTCTAAQKRGTTHQAMMVGSSAYLRPLMLFTRLAMKEMWFL
jgi:hypothetical protein